MPEAVEQVAFDELAKLNAQGQDSHETSIIRNYLDLLVALPWTVTEEKDIDIREASQAARCASLWAEENQRTHHSASVGDEAEKGKAGFHSAACGPSGYG
jgi:ATP-dependent Lon protease